MTTLQTILVLIMAFLAGWNTLGVSDHIDHRRYGKAANSAMLALWWGANTLFWLGAWR